MTEQLRSGTRAYDEHLPPPELWPDLVFSRPEFEYPETLNLATELLDVHVANGHGADPAVLFEDREVSYAELERMTNRIGHALLGLGVQPGDRVALRLPNQPVFVAAWLAIQKIGAVAVSTMPMLRARELTYIANDSGAIVFLCAAQLLDELVRARDGFDHPVVVVVASSSSLTPASLTPASTDAGDSLNELSLDELTAGAPEELDAYPTKRDELALIAYTSGSTGIPKGTAHCPTDILAAADGYARSVLQTTRQDVFSGHPTLAFTFGLGALLVFPLRVGAATALIDRFTPDAMLSVVQRRRVTLLFCTATTYRMLLQDPALEHTHDMSSLRLSISAGETLPEIVYKDWRRRTGVEILDGIGATEMFHIFLSARPGASRPGTTGMPVPGYEAKIVDDQFVEVPRGTPGLLAVRGPTGCRYWRRPEAQRIYVRNGWNVTGDVYIEDADGYFWFQCRNDDMILCGGYNIAGPEVESVLLEHSAVVQAAVVASPDPVRGFVPKAFVVLKDEFEAGDDLIASLQNHVKAELAPYKYPREVEFVTSLPKTETGKIRRDELRRRERERKAARI